jgi:hypothetical protein
VFPGQPVPQRGQRGADRDWHRRWVAQGQWGYWQSRQGRRAPLAGCIKRFWRGCAHAAEHDGVQQLLVIRRRGLIPECEYVAPVAAVDLLAPGRVALRSDSFMTGQSANWTSL